MVGCEGGVKVDKLVESATERPDLAVMECGEVGIGLQFDKEVLLGSVDAEDSNAHEAMLSVSLQQRRCSFMALQISMFVGIRSLRVVWSLIEALPGHRA